MASFILWSIKAQCEIERFKNELELPVAQLSDQSYTHFVIKGQVGYNIESYSAEITTVWPVWL